MDSLVKQKQIQGRVIQRIIGNGIVLVINKAAHHGISLVGAWTLLPVLGGRTGTRRITIADNRIGITMVARIKDKGSRELHNFKKRVLQVAALGRIDKSDADWLVEKTEEMERYLGEMDEKSGLEKVDG